MTRQRRKSRSSQLSLLVVFIVGLALGYSLAIKGSSPEETHVGAEAGVEIYGPFFCPEDHCSSVVINWIERANKSIDLAIYSFTLDSISDALLKASSRGVRVRVIMEREQVNRYSEYTKLKKRGVEVMLDKNDHYMHNKFMVIDGKVVLTGSYNYTLSADRYNDENLIVILDRRVAEAYESEFEEMWNGKFGS